MSVPYQAYRSKRHSRNLSNPDPTSPSPELSVPETPETPPTTVLEVPETPTTTILEVPETHATTTIEVPETPTTTTKPVPDISETPPRQKKTSTFRRLPAKTASRAAPSALLSPLSPPPSSSSALHSPPPSLLSPPSSLSPSPPSLLPPLPSLLPPPPSLLPPPPSPPPPTSGPPKSTSSERKSAPYRPGFQPKGIYRPLTESFLHLRQVQRDGPARVERTKLERRLEKLLALHFPPPNPSHDQEKRPAIRPLPNENRRASSIFDFNTLKNINFNDPSDIWRGVVTGGLIDSAKNEIRSAEQRITPWQDDASVTKCPLCSTSFHPLTNRKHHCRLCGQIICSLPVKHPHRIALCSILFVVDKQSRSIEEVGEGVDYGVRKRRPSGVSGQLGKQEEEEKFLKGVRICRDCRPILLRQQYQEQMQIVPPFVRLYQTFKCLETEIEDALPKFHELVLSLAHHDQPTKEAQAARKRLLDSFSQYDKISKKIRALPCPNGPGSSQDRVQTAILTRANLFLQKNMFPLQSLSSFRPTGQTTKPDDTTSNDNLLDIDATLARTVQPLLEQEALLESFIEEAQARRKFEDVKALKVSLAEIKQEIERILAGETHPR